MSQLGEMADTTRGSITDRVFALGRCKEVPSLKVLVV